MIRPRSGDIALLLAFRMVLRMPKALAVAQGDKFALGSWDLARFSISRKVLRMSVFYCALHKGPNKGRVPSTRGLSETVSSFKSSFECNISKIITHVAENRMHTLYCPDYTMPIYQHQTILNHTKTIPTAPPHAVPYNKRMAFSYPAKITKNIQKSTQKHKTACSARRVTAHI